MDADAERKLLTMVDVIATQVAAMAGPVALIPTMQGDIAAIRADLNGHRSETRAGFERVDLRLDRLEERIAKVETGR